MWDKVFDGITRPLAPEDPKLIEKVLKANDGFSDWAKYYNPNDIGTIRDGEKILVNMLTEDLQELRMRSDYFKFLLKKGNDEEVQYILGYLAGVADAHFWVATRTKYKLWPCESLGLRDGWKVVEIKCDRPEMPEVLRKIFGI